MAEYSGSALYLAFNGTQLDQDYRSFSESENIEFIDASAGSDTWRPKLTTLKDGSFEFELVDQTSGTTLWQALAPGTSGTLEWGPEGTTSGLPRYYVTADIGERSRELPYADIVVISVSGEFNDVDGPTETVY